METQAKKYNKLRLAISIAEGLVGFLLLAIFLASGASLALRQIVNQYTASPSLIVAGYILIIAVVATLLDMPVSYFTDYRLEHKFNLSNQSRRNWLLDQLKGLGLELALGIPIVEMIYFLLRQYPHNWWLIGGVAFGLIFIVLANLAPVLLIPIFYKMTPLKDEELTRRLMNLAQRAETKVRGVYEMNLSQKTKKANAGLTGLGNTRRIIVSDTMLADYTADEIEVVLAHELGHHVHHHLNYGLIIQSSLMLLSLYIINLVLRIGVPYFNLSGIGDIAGLPLLILVSMLVTLAAMPLSNALSRYMEYQSDTYALTMTKDYRNFTSVMEKLARQNLADPSPHPLVEFLFYSHPSIPKRIRLCQDMERKSAG